MQQVEPYRLTTLPQILLELQLELQKPERSFASVSNIVGKDPALIVRVIAVAQSNEAAALEIPGNLNSLCAAVGYDGLQAIAFSSATYQAYRSYQNDQILYFERHWCRSFFGAEIARSLAKITSYRDPEEAYLCAMVRGIGQVVMEIQSNGSISKQMASDHSIDNCLNFEVEQFGINHTLLSAHLMDDWGVNSGFSDAIKYQSKPIDSIRDAHQLVQILNLASQAVDRGAEQFVTNTNILFGIDATTALAVFTRTRELASEEAEKYQIDWRELDHSHSISGITPESPQLVSETSHRFREKHQQLRDQVKDISLVSSICRFDAGGQTEGELLSVVRGALQSLLNISSSVFFLYGKHSDTIKVAEHEEVPEFLKEISIPIEYGRSLLSNALLDKKPIRFVPDELSDLENLTVVDRQFLNFMGTSGLYCFPICAEEKVLGVLLLGIDQWHQDAISESSQLIQILMTQLSSILTDFYWRQQEQQDIAKNNQQTYEMSVKKAIHEANNPLSVIQNYLEILGRKLDDNSSAKENLLIVKSEINRVCEILGQLGRQTTTDEPVFTWFNLNKLIADQVKIFDSANSPSNQIETTLELAEELPMILGSENALKQILTNLILNAIEAMPGGGTISVSTADQFYINEKCYVEITVQDTGTGIDAALMPKLFEVKRSLKGKKHAGVGLNIVQNLVSKMDGLITCRNSKKGVTWQILLPRKIE